MFYDNQVTTASAHFPILLVHGGAWAIPADAAAAHESGVRRALETGYALLSRGASALDAVEAAVTVLEDDPTFDAGRGSFLTSDGRVQLDALLMDGGRMKAGGVACVERLRNPIQAARLVLEKSQHVYFVGPGAEQFAQAHGMALIDNSELVLDRERQRLLHAQARNSAGFADETFSGPDISLPADLHDDKSPETAVLLAQAGHPSSADRTHIFADGDSVTKDSATGSFVSGHDFTACEKMQRLEQEASGHDFTACEKMQRLEQEASGHDFSRADTIAKKINRALAPEGKQSLPRKESRTESADSMTHAKGPRPSGQDRAEGRPPTAEDHDTVGAVALDSRGNLAAATSTGGTLNKTPGRVGDSSLIGCGCYADNLSAAVSLTGWGEPIMKLVLGKWATDRVASGIAPDLAASEAIAYLFNRLGGHGGIILLGPDGRFGLAHNTPAMAWGLATPTTLQTGLTI
jgi:isoaspartyl peptidase/L-asparaginase-like protein (Ntn-hydrolase superfamily)